MRKYLGSSHASKFFPLYNFLEKSGKLLWRKTDTSTIIAIVYGLCGF